VAGSEYTEVRLEHNFAETFSAEFDIVPPSENAVPSDVDESQLAANQRRLDEEDAIRHSHDHSNPAVRELMLRQDAAAQILLSSLSAKDLCDLSAEVIDDVLDNCSSLDPFVLSPRVSYEHLVPFRGEILSSGIASALQTASDVAVWVRDNIHVDDVHNPQGLLIPPVYVWRSRESDRQSRDIFYVALCRCLGFPARIDEVTGKLQCKENELWTDVSIDGVNTVNESPKGYLAMSYEPVPAVRDPKYYRHFTLATITSDETSTLEFGTDADDTPLSSFDAELSLDSGYYSLVSGSRMSDGSVLAHIEYFNVLKDSLSSVPLILRQSPDKLSVLGSFDADLFLKDSGRGYYILAVLGESDEPSVHARLEFESIASELNAWGRPVIFVGGSAPQGLDDALRGDYDPSMVKDMLLAGCDVSPVSLPVIAMCDSFGRVVYLSQGYNTSLAENLRKVVVSISAE